MAIETVPTKVNVPLLRFGLTWRKCSPPEERQANFSEGRLPHLVMLSRGILSIDRGALIFRHFAWSCRRSRPVCPALDILRTSRPSPLGTSRCVNPMRHYLKVTNDNNLHGRVPVG
jgi:hypothetical protein